MQAWADYISGIANSDVLVCETESVAGTDPSRKRISSYQRICALAMTAKLSISSGDSFFLAATLKLVR